MRLLVTGCGRSGTKWAARAVTAAGVGCGHEEAFSPYRQDIGDGGWRAEASWCAAPFTPLAGTHVVHLVRHPLLVVASLVHRGSLDPSKRRWGIWAFQFHPEVAEIEDPVRRAAAHWVAWNRLVAADETVRLEDVAAADVQRWARHVDEQAALRELPGAENVSHPRPGVVTWDQVADVDGLVDLAEEIGYMV